MLQESEDVGKESSSGHDLATGSLWSAIWVMSWPLLLTTVAGSIVGMIDVQVAGLIGSAAQAAVGLAEQVLFLFMLLVMSVGVGTTAVVSRSFGAGDRTGSILATGQSLSLSLIMGVVLCTLAFATASLILPFFTTSADVLRQGQLYLSIFALQLLPFSIASIINAAFRAVGDAKTPLMVTIVATSITIALDYATVVGNWPVAGLGIKGIALASVIGSSAATVVALFQLRRSAIADSLKKLWPLSPPELRKVMTIGIPSALQRLSWAASVFVLFFILSRCDSPTAALASWTIGMRVEGLLFMPLMAFSLAVSSIVGQNLGARQIDRAFKAGWHVTWVGVALMTVLGAALFLGAEPFAEFMSKDAKTVEYTVDYLRINAISEPFLAVGMILAGALQGAGDTRTPMWISLFTNWVVRLPLAWVLSLQLHQGPMGAWIAMTVSVVIMGALQAWRFQSGSWVKTRV